jgi:hypothetical protein
MKNLKTFLLLSVFCFVLLSPSVAEESYNYTFEIVKCQKAPTKRLLSKKDWKQFLDKSRAVVLENIQGVARNDRYSLVFEGVKNPISYKDPRAGGYQVQYTDLGVKVDIKIKSQNDGTLFVESRGDRSVASPIPEHPERSSVMIYESGVTMKRGQTVVVASAKGIMNVRYLKEHFPDISVSESDYLMMVITVE